MEAVIDKDRFSSLLAATVRADPLVFITSVDSAYTDFGKPAATSIRRIRSKDMMKLVAEGHFAPGSMGPKVISCLDFLENGGKKALICSIGNIDAALKGKAGTTITG